MGIRIVSGGGTAGVAGAGISNIAYKSQDPSGDYIYTITLTDGSTYDFNIPKAQDINLATAQPNELVIKHDDGTLKGSGLFLDGGNLITEKDIVANSLTVSPNTVTIGAIQISENGGFLETIPKTSGKHYLLLDYENDAEHGTSRPIYYARGEKNEGSNTYKQIYSVDTDTMSNITTYHHGMPSTDSQVQALYFKFANAVTNFRMCVDIGGNEISYYPSKSAWDNGTGGLDFASGRREITLDPFFSFLTEYDITFKFKADGNIDLLGDGINPWLAVDRNLITKHEIALKEDIGGVQHDSIQEIVQQMETLTGDEKLSASAVRDIPMYDDTTLKTRVAVNESNVAINRQSIADNLKEIQRIKTNVALDTNPSFSGRFNGDITNIIPSDAPYHGYFVTVASLANNPQVLNLPHPLVHVAEGVVFMVNNHDVTKSITLTALQGETISGSTTLNVGAGEMAVLIKTTLGWDEIMSGVIPPSLADLRTLIKAELPPNTGGTNPGLTIDEISAQLKDRLHTFREIHDEFNSELHTYDELITQGFDNVSIFYGFRDSTSPLPTESDNWRVGRTLIDRIAPIPATHQGDKYIGFVIPLTIYSILNEVRVNGALIETTEHDYIKSSLKYKLLLSVDKVSTNSDISIEFIHIDSGTGGIDINDGSTDKAGIKKINIKGAYLDNVFDDSDEVTLKSVTSWETLDGMTGSKTNRILIEPPLLTYLDPSTNPGEEARAKLYIQHDYFELKKPPGYLAYLTEDEEVIGRIKPNEAGVRVGTVWFDDIVYGGDSEFIEFDKANKAIGIQDYTGDDPNVTGGVPTLIAYRIAMKGTAPDDGYVEIILKKTDEGTPTQNGDYLLDANDEPIGVRRNYKAGDELGVLDVMAIYNAKGITKFQCLLEHNFADDGVLIEDRTEGASGIMIQALDKENSTGDALLQFENDTNQNIEFTKHYNGEDIFNMAWALGHDMADADINAGVGQTSVDGLHFYNNTNLKVGVANKTMHIHDNGTDMAYYTIGQIFSTEKTSMLRGKDLDIKVTLQDKNEAYRIYMVKWTEIPDAYTTKIFTDNVNDNPTVESGWVIEDSVFITEAPLLGEHDFAGTLTVPSDAVNFAIVLAPIKKQSPSDLYLKSFEVNVSDAFYGWVLEYPEKVHELHLVNSERHAELRCDLGSSYEVRYTLNNVPAGQPMPIGVIKSGKADIEIDHTINQVPGSQLPQFEGAIKFNKEGTATIQTDLYVHSEKTHDVLATTKFWYSKVSTDGSTFTKIPLSEYDVQVRGQTKAINHMPKFKLTVQAGDRIALFGTSDQADGAFIDTNQGSIPMLKTVIDFDEITESEQQVLDSINDINQRIYFTPEALAQDLQLVIDWDEHNNKGKITIDKR